MFKTSLCILSCLFVVGSGEPLEAGEWPMVDQYVFSATATATTSATTTAASSSTQPHSCSETQSFDVCKVSHFGFVPIPSTTFYYEDIGIQMQPIFYDLDDNMCHPCFSFKVEKGIIHVQETSSSSSEQNYSDQFEYQAYKIDPTVPASSYIATPTTQLLIRIPSPSTLSIEKSCRIFQFLPAERNNAIANFVKLREIKNIHPPSNDYIKTQIPLSTIIKPIIIMIVPESQHDPTIWPKINSSLTKLPHSTPRRIQNAKLFDTQISIPQQQRDIKLSLYAQLLPVHPFHPFHASQDWQISPNTKEYSHSFRRTFTRIVYPSTTIISVTSKKLKWENVISNMVEGVIWQDQSNWNIYLTYILPNQEYKYYKVSNPRNHYLVAATTDGGQRGDIIYITVERMDNDDSKRPLRVTGRRITYDGRLIRKKIYDTQVSGLNIYSHFASHSTLTWNTSTNQVGWMISRGGYYRDCSSAIILDDDTLTVVANKGRTSTMSWTNHIEVMKDSKTTNPDFLAVDLGSDDPRSLQIHRFNTVYRISKHVFHYKAQHSMSMKSPSGFNHDYFPDISGKGTVYFQWSMDERIYIEMAQPPVLQLGNGNVMVIVSAEKDFWNHKNAHSYLNSPRNIGIMIVSNDLKEVISIGESTNQKYYDKEGNGHYQINKGIIWLTDFTPYTSNLEEWENAVRVKSALVESNLILIFYEVWSYQTYIRTEILGIDSFGQFVFDRMILPYPIRLCPSDTVEVVDGQVIVFGTDETGKNIIRFHFKVDTI